MKSCFYHESKINFYNTHIPPIIYYYNWIQKWENYNNTEILKLNYENFINDKLNFIKKILNFVEFSDNKKFNEISKLIINQSNDQNLVENLGKFGRNVSTFRSGNIGDFNKLLKVSTKNKFFEFLENQK